MSNENPHWVDVLQGTTSYAETSRALRQHETLICHWLWAGSAFNVAAVKEQVLRTRRLPSCDGHIIPVVSLSVCPKSS
jgi:hypothetical protein